MELWEPRNDVFPDGFKFTEPLPLALHNRWMSGVNNTYIEDLGFASSFIVEEKSDFALVRSHPSLRVRARAAASPALLVAYPAAHQGGRFRVHDGPRQGLGHGPVRAGE